MKKKYVFLILLIILTGSFFLKSKKQSVSILDFFTFDNIVMNKKYSEENPFNQKYKKRFRLAIISYLIPRILHKKGRIMKNYLSKNLGVEIVPVYSANYDSLGELIKAGKAEIVWGAPSLYKRIKNVSDYSVACKVQNMGKSSYSSLLIVKKDSPYKTLSDLEGKKITYVDPGSSSGFHIPNKFFEEQNIDPKSFFSSIEFAGSHDIAVKNVIEGKVDIATVYDSIMDIKSYLIDTGEIRILCNAGTVPQAPILVSNKLTREEKQKISDLFINAEKYPGGKEFIEELFKINNTTGFVKASKKEYE